MQSPPPVDEIAGVGITLMDRDKYYKPFLAVFNLKHNKLGPLRQYTQHKDIQHNSK
jgi:hypothetical protein